MIIKKEFKDAKVEAIILNSNDKCYFFSVLNVETIKYIFANEIYNKLNTITRAVFIKSLLLKYKLNLLEHNLFN